ncbi:MAG: ion transporter [Lachnospiraceae bacterium]|nr:ion transporter [Lachnospiraceae bacterium]
MGKANRNKKDKEQKNLKKRIFEIIQIGQIGDAPSRAFDMMIVTVILANIACMYMDTFDELNAYHGIFSVVEMVTVSIFIVEYALRIWTADYLYSSVKPMKARLKFLTSFEGVVDLLTILPFFFLSGMVVFRMLRVVRVLHLFRLNPYSDSLSVITSVLYEKRKQIYFSIFILLLLMLGGSLCIYNVEHEVNPDQFENAFSGFWWAMATVFTIGYGDIYPITTVGKIVTIIMSFLGVGVVAVPTGIISAGFVEHYNRESYKNNMIDLSHIGEIRVDKECAGMGVGTFMQTHNCRIFLVFRDGYSLLPTDNLFLEEGDILVLQSERLTKPTSKSRLKTVNNVRI